MVQPQNGERWLNRIPWGLVTVVGSLMLAAFSIGTRVGSALFQQTSTVQDEEKTRKALEDHERAQATEIASLRVEVQSSRDAMARQFGGEHKAILDRLDDMRDTVVEVRTRQQDVIRRVDALEKQRGRSP